MLKLEELCQALVEDVEAESIQGKTVTLKIKTTEFKVGVLVFKFFSVKFNQLLLVFNPVKVKMA